MHLRTRDRELGGHCCAGLRGWVALQKSGRDEQSASISEGREGPELSAGLVGGGRLRVGGGLRPFVPGPLADRAVEAFFQACGYQHEREQFSWDVVRSLSDYEPPELRDVQAAARPGQAEPGKTATRLSGQRVSGEVALAGGKVPGGGRANL